ncbi:LysM peptidoglycan-binding domain-containing protein [Marivirga sp.]|uniref:LysM peptidoglycan-binding domain-containing protein n=1 Tax=Marivirga sp. TaxID=2018662 RepID=UPI002D80C511|nr:LysM peptidoglycan-binding domain-containing protein [Marivirga sp.]HET8858418.1 LysM peptidoglycan-binding domain-containing protein [Marivirga sp.]
MNSKLPILLTAIFILSTKLWAQQVPSRMEFANMDLRLTAGAIKDIQADVDALTRSEKYFQKKLERVDMYMPIIERIFKEEGLPDDFKYLVIQESALVSDAVSSSNAVGFWQFKEISGLENNLRIDRQVDERMNIVSSSRAAAAYLKDHNKYFDNWAYALIAYQRGRGGAADVIDEDNFGKSSLKITSDTYWYLKKFLAHKVAFENTLGTSNPPYYLREIDNVKGSSLKKISKEENVSIELLEEYNKWLKRGDIPEDKNYTVIVPLKNLEKIEKLQKQQKTTVKELPGNLSDSEQQKFPLVENYPNKSDRSIPHEVEINGLDGIYAPEGYTVKKLAEIADVDEYKFRKWNDLKIREELETGRIYYLRRKRNRAKFYYHTVAQNENMWGISQKYGLKLKKLYRKNRMEPPQEPKEGRVLWLRHNRPANVEIEYREAPKNKQKTGVKVTQNNENSLIQATPEVKKEPSDTTALIKKSSSLESEELKLNSEPDSSNATIIKKEINDSILSRDSIAALSFDSTEHSSKVVQLEKSLETEQEVLQSSDVIEEMEEDEPELMNYSIRKGDTFFAIANRFDMKISRLLSVNSLQIRDTLSIGQVIRVNKMDIENPENEPILSQKKQAEKTIATSEIQHKVSPGETMYALARKYNVSLKEIMEWNNKEDYNLRDGELILIKKK